MPSANPNAGADLAEIKHALVERVEDLAEALLGQPNAETRRLREWRWGAKGSMSLVVRGPKRGEFYSHEAGTGGSPLDMIAHARACNFVGAVEWAKGWLGIDGELPSPANEGWDEDTCKKWPQAASSCVQEGLPLRTARSVGYLIEKARSFGSPWRTHSRTLRPNS